MAPEEAFDCVLSVTLFEVIYHITYDNDLSLMSRSQPFGEAKKFLSDDSSPFIILMVTEILF